MCVHVHLISVTASNSLQLVLQVTYSPEQYPQWMESEVSTGCPVLLGYNVTYNTWFFQHSTKPVSYDQAIVLAVLPLHFRG